MKSLIRGAAVAAALVLTMSSVAVAQPTPTVTPTPHPGGSMPLPRLQATNTVNYGRLAKSVSGDELTEKGVHVGLRPDGDTMRVLTEVKLPDLATEKIHSAYVYVPQAFAPGIQPDKLTPGGGPALWSVDQFTAQPTWNRQGTWLKSQGPGFEIPFDLNWKETSMRIFRYDVTDYVKELQAKKATSAVFGVKASNENDGRTYRRLWTGMQLEIRKDTTGVTPAMPNVSSVGYNEQPDGSRYLQADEKQYAQIDLQDRDDVHLHLNFAGAQGNKEFVSTDKDGYGQPMTTYSLPAGEYTMTAWTALINDPSVKSDVTAPVKIHVIERPTISTATVSVNQSTATFEIHGGGNAVEACVDIEPRARECSPLTDGAATVSVNSLDNGTHQAEVYTQNLGYGKSQILKVPTTVNNTETRYVDVDTWSLNQTLTSSAGKRNLLLNAQPVWEKPQEDSPYLHHGLRLGGSTSGVVHSALPKGRTGKLGSWLDMKEKQTSPTCAIATLEDSAREAAVVGVGLHDGKPAAFVQRNGTLEWTELKTGPTYPSNPGDLGDPAAPGTPSPGNPARTKHVKRSGAPQIGGLGLEYGNGNASAVLGDFEKVSFEGLPVAQGSLGFRLGATRAGGVSLTSCDVIAQNVSLSELRNG